MSPRESLFSFVKLPVVRRLRDRLPVFYANKLWGHGRTAQLCIRAHCWLLGHTWSRFNDGVRRCTNGCGGLTTASDTACSSCGRRAAPLDGGWFGDLAGWTLGHGFICCPSCTEISDDPTKRVEATTTPEGAKGWADQAGSAQVLAGGHGLDVAPDASPEGVRAETRRREQDGGGEPSNAPDAALIPSRCECGFSHGDYCGGELCKVCECGRTTACDDCVEAERERDLERAEQLAEEDRFLYGI